ncbi:MAG: ribosome biogenesis GTPase YlqF [Clostridia bacterium]|nr:ribosome biogenesis GTPase YlqF [Clostridia bacterium]
MQTIQWYPGHMTKAIRMMKENISLVDAAVYILDARVPAACLNPDFVTLLNGKPVLMLLNKSDLAEKAKTDAWVEYFKRQGIVARAICATSRSVAGAVTSGLKSVLAEKIARNEAKGVKKPMRAMVIGIPNCGKSTVINSVAGGKRALTGDKPGVTKGKQWIRLDTGIELLDTPGTLWRAFEDQQIARHLAYIGSINDEILDLGGLCICLLEELYARYPGAVAARYKIEEGDPVQGFTDICKRRGFVVRGGELDYERGARAVLDDFRKGRIALATLEDPS